MIQTLLQIDGNLLLWIQEAVRNDLLTPFLIFLTKLGDAGFIWIVISLALLCNKKTRSTGIMSFAALAGSLLLNNMILKNLIARTRPYDMISGLQLLIERQVDYSFPSGHTAAAFASAVILFLSMPGRYGAAALTGAVLIAFSRLYVGVHYPSDVLAGALSGTMIALAVRQVYLRFCTNQNQDFKQNE